MRRTCAAAMTFLLGCSIEAPGLGRSSDGGLEGPDGHVAVVRDAGEPDSNAPDRDAALDAGTMQDAGADAGPPDAGPPPCVPEVEACNAEDDDCDGAIDEATACEPCDREELDGHVYLFCVTSADWDEARADCLARGYDLVAIDDDAEQSWLWSVAGPLSGDEYFIGLSDAADEGDFVWVDGSAVLYTHWRSTAPDDYGSGEDCVELDRGAAGEWEDVPCDQSQSYVCEKGS